MKIKNLFPILGLIILIIILSTLDLQKIVDIFLKINPIYSLLSFLVVIPLILLANIGWQLILKKQKINVSFGYSIKNFFIGYFYGFITPGAFGAYIRSVYLSKKSGVQIPKCVSNIIIFNTLEYLGLLTIGAIGAIYLSSIFNYLFFLIIIIIIVVTSLFLFFFKDKRSRVLFVKIIQSIIFSTIKDKIEKSLTSFYEDIPKLKDIVLPFSISIFGWILKYIMLFFIAKMFFIEIPFFTFILIMAVAEIIASVPISIYGLGTREATLITIFKIWGIESENIVSFSLFLFVLIWLSPSVIGAVVTFFETKKLDKFALDEKTIKNFESYMKKYLELYRYTAEIVKRNISKKVSNPIIIDIGAGPGLLSLEIAKKIPKAQVIAIDPSEDMLELANKNVKNEKFKTMRGSSDNISLENNFADIVVSRFSLTYWKNPNNSFIEIHRVLKPGGKFVLEALNKDFPKYKLFLIKIHMFFKSAGSDVIRYHIESYKTAYKIQNVEIFLKKTGYKITYKEFDKDKWKYLIVAEKKYNNKI